MLLRSRTTETQKMAAVISTSYTGSGNPVGYNNIALFNDSRVSYDLLRFATMLVLPQSVREMISPYTVFARNHISNEEECTVRVNKLHLIPWLSMYVSPANSIVQNDTFPILPLDVEWTIEQHDRTVLDYNPAQRRGFKMTTTVGPDDSLIPSSTIKPISASSIAIPANSSAILNFSGGTQDRIEIEREKTVDVNEFCLRDVRLSLVASSPSDFLMESSNAGESEIPKEEEDNGEPLKQPLIKSGRPKARDDYLDFLRSTLY